MPITRDQENQMIVALGTLVGWQLIHLLDAQGPAAGPVFPPLINNNPQ